MCLQTDKRSTFIRKLQQLQQRCVHPTWQQDGAAHLKQTGEGVLVWTNSRNIHQDMNLRVRLANAYK